LQQEQKKKQLLRKTEEETWENKNRRNIDGKKEPGKQKKRGQEN